MRNADSKNVFASLKFQLCAGATLLLAITLASISYLLIEYQTHTLERDLQSTIVLQGRNIALSSAKGLLRPDPEFELQPLVTRITEGAEHIESLVITDAELVIHADLELQRVGSTFELNVGEMEVDGGGTLAAGERLFYSASGFLFRTPIKSLDKDLGYVFMTYSKASLNVAIKRAIQITIVLSMVAFLLGIALALWFFRRISRPLDVLMAGVSDLGRGNLDKRIDLPTRNEFRHLASAFNQMAMQLKTAQEEQLVKKLFDRELEIAQDIQETLIPSDIQQPDGYHFSLHYQAARQVGGDYVDIIRLDDRRIAFLIADVSGKGIPGLVVMAMLKTMAHELLKSEEDLRQVVRQLNILLAANMRPQMFVTMSLALLDTETGELRHASAGHNPVIIYRHAQGCSAFDKLRGRPLAIFPDDDFYPHLDEHRLVLAPGDLALFYTDGLQESMNIDGVQLGLERVRQLCDQYGPKGAEVTIEALVRAERSFRGDHHQHDDLTLLAVGATAADAGAIDAQPREVEEWS